MSDEPPREPAGERLESWKVIAAYLNRDPRTVMRWERTEGLPVHRHRHLTRSTVYALPRELDEWQASRQTLSSEPAPTIRRPARRVLALVAAGIVGLVSAGDARLRLVDAATQTGPIDRVVDVPAGALTPAISSDGRYVSYIDRSTREVHVRDLSSRATWQLTHMRSPEGDGYLDRSAISHDDRFVAIAADNASETRKGIWIVPLSPSDSTPPRLLTQGEGWIEPRAWAPDDQQILFTDEHDDLRTDIGLVSVADGSRRVLVTQELEGPPSDHVVLSPDGLFVAYDVQAEPDSRQRDVYVVGVHGGPPVPVLTGMASDSVVGWASDGSRLIVLSDRPGSQGMGLWALPVAGGRSAGEPTLLVSNFRGSVWSLTAGDALFYDKTLGPPQVLLTTRVDLETGARLGEPELAAHDRESPSRRPRWSPDGRSLLYETRRAAGPVYAIQAIANRVVREIPLNLSYIWTFDWSPDGRSVVCRCRDLQAREGIFLIDLQTGATNLIGRGVVPQFAADGDGVTYYGQWNGQGRYLLEQTLATGEERPILPRLPRLQPPQVEVSDPVEPPLGGGRLRRSPDGQVLLGGQTYADRTILLTYDLRTEETRVVFEIDRPAAINTEDGVQWTADGRALVANVRGEAENQFELWWIPVDGRAPHRLDIGVDDLVNSAVAVHPDGKHVAFVAGRPTFGRTSTADYEFRKLEQFVAPIQADETAR